MPGCAPTGGARPWSGRSLLVLVVLSLITVTSATRGGDLDPDNPGANGARAVARVLAGHGVQVTVVRRAAGLEAAALDRDTTVVVTSTDQLGRATARALGARVVSAGAVVLAAPGSTVLEALRLPLEPDDADGAGSTAARCDDDLLAGLTVDVGPSTGYHTAGSGSVGCFRGDGERPAALVARVDRRVTTYAVGGTDVLTNEHVAQADNAAVALRLLGQRDRLVWYVPDRRDIVGRRRGLRARPAAPSAAARPVAGRVRAAGACCSGGAVGSAAWWWNPCRSWSRRWSPPRDAGRLYRRVRDRPHAAEILRAAARRRLAARLRLPASTAPRALVLPVAQATGRDPATRSTTCCSPDPCSTTPP